MIPRIRRLLTETRGPEHNLVLVKHTVSIVIEVNVVAQTIVIVVPRRDQWCRSRQFQSIDDPIAIPVIVSPIENAIVIVIPDTLLLTDETQSLLDDIQNAVVIVVRILAIWYTIVVVVDVVIKRGQQTLA